MLSFVVLFLFFLARGTNNEEYLVRRMLYLLPVMLGVSVVTRLVNC